MALRLGDYVIYGELRNTSRYSTHGLIALRGNTLDEDTVLRVELTGDCGADLKGKVFRFMPSETAIERPVFRSSEFPGFQDRQIGPTGTMTAQGWVRMLPCSTSEYLRRAELGEAPPTQWKRRLYLEWYSQNGRVLIEMGDATVEECVRTPVEEDDEGEWAPIPNLAPRPETEDAPSAQGPSFTVLNMDGDHTEIERWAPLPGTDDSELDAPQRLASRDLQLTFDAEAAAIDRAIRGASDDSDDDLLYEYELMDYCMENCEGEPVGSLLDGADGLPKPETLNDEQVEIQLKSVLAQLALCGVALDCCKHFTPRDCYKLLIETILPKSNAYRELAGTGWVQHFSAWEYCPQCEAEDAAKYETMKESGEPGIQCEAESGRNLEGDMET